jgi:hypothetical protein
VTQAIDDLFDDLDDPFYPGSKQKRRDHDPVVLARQERAEERYGWDAKPVLKNVGGKPMEMFTAGDLGAALGGFSVVSVRLWESKGYIPKAPYRMPDVQLADGKTQKGRRYYSRAIVEGTIHEFEKRGLLGKRRIEWSRHPDLPIALVERWREITGTKYVA